MFIIVGTSFDGFKNDCQPHFLKLYQYIILWHMLIIIY